MMTTAMLPQKEMLVHPFTNADFGKRKVAQASWRVASKISVHLLQTLYKRKEFSRSQRIAQVQVERRQCEAALADAWVLQWVDGVSLFIFIYIRTSTMQKCLVVTQTGRKCQNGRNCPHHRQTGGELPAFLALPLRGLTLASKEIPVGGQAVALIDVIMRNAALVEKFIELRKSSEIIQQLTTIHFRDGPDGVKRQFDQLWSSIPATQHASYCDVVPRLYNDLLIAVCGWVETIPTVGPPCPLLSKPRPDLR